MITSAWKFGKDIEEVNSIRASVSLKADSYDEKSMHLIIYNDDIAAGCSSLYFDSGCYHIASVSVKPEFQKQFIGDLMIRLLLVKAFNMMAESVRVNATADTVDFFKRYGFSETEANSLILEVTPDTLVMNSKCGHDCSKCANKEHCSDK